MLHRYSAYPVFQFSVSKWYWSNTDIVDKSILSLNPYTVVVHYQKALFIFIMYNVETVLLVLHKKTKDPLYEI